MNKPLKNQAPPDYHQQIIASLTSGVIAVDRDMVIVASNPAASRHLDIDENLIVPGNKLDRLPEAEPFVQFVCQMKETREPVSRREILLTGKDGAKKYIGVSASLLEGPHEFNGVTFLFIDMTEMRNLERTAELNRQLAQIGELTAGVVHELRNPLSVISGMAELLIRKLDPEDERRKTLEMIFDEAAHLERAISRFLGFAKPFDLRLRRCRPEDIADRAYRLCTREAKKKDVYLEVVTDPGAPMIIADLEKASEALGNIVDNAIDAVPDQGGRVTLHTSFDDREIVFVVTDNGPGLDLEPGQDPFRPFFTLKDGGTGLGLSIVKRIVSAHKGAVTYANLEQGGACFEVRIPIEG